MRQAQPVSAGSDGFGWRLLSLLAREAGAGNILLSPASLSAALAMVLNGARGDARVQLAAGLGLAGFERATLNAGFRSLRESWSASGPDVTLTTANALWTRQGLTLAAPFVQRVAEAFAAESAELDFLDPAAAETINSWARQATAGNIDGLVNPGLLADALLVLTNAIYFRGLWREPFLPEQTEERLFRAAGGPERALPLMRRNGEMAYYEDERAQVVSLPYGDGRFAFTVALPQPDRTVVDLIADLTAERWWSWQRECRERQGTLWLPRFQLDYGADLMPALARMGLFGGEQDLGDMGQGTLAVSNVIHRALLDVDEQGTTAAAVTAVLVRKGGLFLDRPFEMLVDRPFLCAVLDRKAPLMLFMALVADPAPRTEAG